MPQRSNVPELDEILEQEFKVLNHGYVRLIDYMGTDEDIVRAARVSYSEGTRAVREDRGLIRYLLSHHHSTPFEMCEIKRFIPAWAGNTGHQADRHCLRSVHPRMGGEHHRRLAVLAFTFGSSPHGRGTHFLYTFDLTPGFPFHSRHQNIGHFDATFSALSARLPSGKMRPA